MNWDEILQSDDYQNADDYQREVIRNDFKENAVRQYGLDENQAKTFRDRFDQVTAPRGNVLSEWDSLKSIGSGALSATADMAQGVTLGQQNAASKYLRGMADEMAMDRRPSTIESVENFGFGDGQEITGKGLLYSGLSGLGSMAPMLVGGGAAGMGAKALGRTASGYGKAKKALDTAESAVDAKAAAQKLATLDKWNDRIGNAAGFGAVGAAMIGGGAGEQTIQEVMALDDNTLYESDAFQEYYRQEYQVNPENTRAAFDSAKKRLADDLATGAFAKAAAAGGISMAVLGSALGKIVMGRGAQGVTKNSFAGAGTEAIQETIETGGQQLATNMELAPLDKRNIWQNVPEAAATGALIGGVVGGAAGAPGGYMNRGRVEASQEDIANRIRDNLNESALAEQQMPELEERLKFLEGELSQPMGNTPQTKQLFEDTRAQRDQVLSDVRRLAMENAHLEQKMRQAQSRPQTFTGNLDTGMNPVQDTLQAQQPRETNPGQWSQWNEPTERVQSERFERAQSNPFNQTGEQRIGRDDGKPFASLDELNRYVGRHELTRYPFHVAKVNGGYVLVGMPDAQQQNANIARVQTTEDFERVLEGQFIPLSDVARFEQYQQASRPVLEHKPARQPNAEQSADLFQTEAQATAYIQRNRMNGTPVQVATGYWRIDETARQPAQLEDKRRTFVDSQGTASDDLAGIDRTGRERREQQVARQHPGFAYDGTDADYQKYSAKASELNRLMRKFQGDPRDRESFNQLRQLIKDTKKLEKAAMEQARASKRSIATVNRTELLRQARTALEAKRMDEFNALVSDIRATNTEEQQRLTGTVSANDQPFVDTRLQQQEYRDYLQAVAYEADTSAREAARASARIESDDSLLTAIGKLGGIHTDSIESTVKENIDSWRKSKGSGILSRYVNRGKNAKTLDDMGRTLSGYGYTDSDGSEFGANTLTDAIMDEVRGRPRFSDAMDDYQAVMGDNSLFGAAQANNTTAPAINAALNGEPMSPAYRKEVIRVLNDAELDPRFSGTTRDMEGFARTQQQNATDDSWYDRYEQADVSYAEGRTGLDSDTFDGEDWKVIEAEAREAAMLADAQANEQSNKVEEDGNTDEGTSPRIRYGSGGRTAEAPSQGTEAGGRVQAEQRGTPEAETEVSDSPTFDLTTQTEAELQQQAEQQQAAEAEAQAKKQQAQQKADADKERNDFVLTGSDSASDQAAARGQTDLLSTSGEVKEDTSSTNLKTKTDKPESKSKDVDRNKIEDVGEKIGGAKKDLWQSIRESLTSNIDIASVPLSKSFPEPNYEKLVAEGADKKGLALIAVIRAQIPSKPRSPYKFKSWTGKVQQMREFASMIMSDDNVLSADRVIDKMKAAESSLRNLAHTAEAIESVDPSQIKRAAKFLIHAGSYTMYNGERFDRSTTIYSLRDEKGREVREVYGKDLKEVQGKAAGYINQAVSKAPEKRRAKIEIFRDRTTDEVFIGYKGASDVHRLKGGFERSRHASEYLDNHRDELEEKLAEMRKGPEMRNKTNRERTGKQHREGDVTAEDFREVFGFRGVEFGNWVEQGRRQKDINRAYDALMDMADILGIPPKAVSLDGSLGMAFGARGRGKYAAHYEPGKVVINLTKTQGAGSLAHEWFHALDNYFSRLDSENTTEPKSHDGWMSRRNRARGVFDNGKYRKVTADDFNVRQEVYDAFKQVEKVIGKGGFADRSVDYDAARSKPYYSTTIEKAARAFERYMLDRMEARNESNDYLVNINKDGGAYPTRKEMDRDGLRQAYDHLFNVIENRKTDKGIALYKLGETTGFGISRQSAEQAADSLMDSLGVRVNVADTEADLPQHVRDGMKRDSASGIKGVFDRRKGQAWIVAGNLNNQQDAVRTILHEVAGHQALTNMFGSTMKNIMARIHNDMPADVRTRIETTYDGQLSGMDEQTRKAVIAEEYLAHLAETNPTSSTLKRFISKVRRVLRQLFPDLNWTQDDVVELLEAARKKLKDDNNPDGPGGGKKDDLAGQNEVGNTAPNVRNAVSSYSSRSSANKDSHNHEKFQREPSGNRYRTAAMDVMNGLPDDIAEAMRRTNAGVRRQQGIVERVKDWFSDMELADKNTWKEYASRAYTGIIDQFDPIARLEKSSNDGNLKEASDSAYKATLRTKNLSGMMTAVLGKGTPMLDKGSVIVRKGSKGLLEIMEPIAKAGNLELWEHWAAAQRAQRLLREGRENLFTQADIDSINRYVDARPDLKKQFQLVQKDYQTFNRQVLDFAEDAGLINGEDRKLWESDDYLPFHRVNRLDDGSPNSLLRSKGLSNQKSGIKRLEGGVEQISPLEAIYRNTESLIDASMKNIAMQRIADIGVDAGVMEKTRAGDRMTSDQVKDRLVELGIINETDSLTDEQVKRWGNMLVKFQDLGEGAVKVSRDGKTEVYQVHDQQLLETMQAMGPDTLNGILKVFAFPKRLLTNLVTSDPGFMVRNFIRDTLSTWMTVHPEINGETLHASMSTAMQRVANGLESDEHWALMMAGGGSGGFYEITPDNIRGNITPGQYKAQHRRAMDNLSKGWQKWQKFGGRFENANRLAVYEDAIAKGASIAEAAHQAQDVLNFTRRGKWQATRILTEIIPFLNARIQGLDRLARGGIDNPQAMLLRGSIYMAASIALWSLFADDERYKSLPEHEKLTWHHFWDSEGNHYRIPKPFEMGAIFATVPEIANNVIFNGEDGKWAGKMIGGVLTDVFALSMPQFMAPAVDVGTNTNSFTGAPILSLGMQYQTPESQYTPWTSETMKALAEAMPDAAPDWMRSPKRLEYLFRGYFGTLGSHALAATDGLTREVRGAPDRPETRIRDIPVLGSFLRGKEPGATRYSTELYEMMREANELSATIKSYQEQGLTDKAAVLEKKHDAVLSKRKGINRYSRKISKLRKEVRRILDNRFMSSGIKRQRIEALNRQINAAYREAARVYGN